MSSIVVGGTRTSFQTGFFVLDFLCWISQLLPPTTESNIVIKYSNQNIVIKYINQSALSVGLISRLNQTRNQI